MKIVALTFCLFLYFLPEIDGGLVGGHSQISVTDPDIVRLGNIAVTKLNQKKGAGEEDVRLVEIIKATRQVVSGSLTTIFFKVCAKGVEKTCEAKIWEQPWLNKTEVTSLECGPSNASSS